jgi:protein-tyrosine phosphatase
MKGKYQFSHEEYTSKFRDLEAEVKHQNIQINLYPGAEVYLYNGVCEDIMKNKLTLADSSYVLIETDLNGFPADMQKNIYTLLRHGFKPILAHAERYVSVMMKSHEAKELINRSVYIQVNAASLLGGYGDKVKQTAWKLVNKGWVHFLGSDHHAKNDYTAFVKAKEKIIEHVDEKTANLLTVTHPKAILNNEKVDYDYVIVHKASRTRYHTKILNKCGL